MRRIDILVCCLATASLLSVAEARADADDCRRAIVKASAIHLRARAKALASCEDRIVAGKLAAGTDCAVEPKTATRLARAATALHNAVAKACGGADRTCGAGGDDIALAASGWDIGACPGLLDEGCTGSIQHCGDVADCLACLGGASADGLIELAYGALDLSSPPLSALEKCQRAVGKGAYKLLRLRSKHLQRCWDRVLRGLETGPCPNLAAEERIARAELRTAKRICRLCGGGDRGCDQSVGALPGTGGSDDLTPAAIGFAAECDDVVVPGGAACGGAVSSLAGIASCLDCAGDFRAACVDAAAIPALSAYPPECGGDDPAGCGPTAFSEAFPGSDGAPWPAAWQAVGSVDVADIQGGRGRFRPTPSGYSLARLYVPLAESDVEATLTMQFEDLDTQGIGFYVRQNGGYLDQSAPTGQGYAVFVEGFRGFHGIGVWREVNGVEQAILIDTGLALANGVAYRVRFRVHQLDASTTRLQARLWPASDPEPFLWNVDTTDATPALQGIAGGIAVDSWSEITWPGPITAHTLVDDVQIDPLCNPLAGIGGVQTVAETFQFTEGPRWRADGTLLFTDIDANTIYRLTPPSTVEVFRTPSDQANGLATDVNGDLLAAEHGARRISRTDGIGTVTTVVGDYLGMAFNSPNDIAVRTDGTLYFTDPHYGLANPGDREIPFNGLFRRTPAGTLVAEWMGGVTAGPNGVALSPDEGTLYMARSDSGELLAWDVAPDGSLGNQRTFATGLTIPDGLCVDTLGNLYVATWGNSVEVFDPSGAGWGSISIPRQATNCAFGGADARSLYVTAHEGLYRVPMVVAGIP